tara:strand:- start:4668 stop:4790 length:123 start_codon:yes stop_codon:yes gene_type:complete
MNAVPFPVLLKGAEAYKYFAKVSSANLAKAHQYISLRIFF